LLYFTHLHRIPQWMDLYQIWHKGSLADVINCAKFCVDRLRGINFLGKFAYSHRNWMLLLTLNYHSDYNYLLIIVWTFCSLMVFGVFWSFGSEISWSVFCWKYIGNIVYYTSLNVSGGCTNFVWGWQMTKADCCRWVLANSVTVKVVLNSIQYVSCQFEHRILQF